MMLQKGDVILFRTSPSKHTKYYLGVIDQDFKDGSSWGTLGQCGVTQSQMEEKGYGGDGALGRMRLWRSVKWVRRGYWKDVNVGTVRALKAPQVQTIASFPAIRYKKDSDEVVESEVYLGLFSSSAPFCNVAEEPFGFTRAVVNNGPDDASAANGTSTTALISRARMR